MPAKARKTDAEWRREALERIAEHGGLPKLVDLTELRRLCDEVAGIFDEYETDTMTVAEALFAEETDPIPFRLEIEDVAVLALAAEAARNLASELNGHADKIMVYITDVDTARRLQATDTA